MKPRPLSQRALAAFRRRMERSASEPAREPPRFTVEDLMRIRIVNFTRQREECATLAQRQRAMQAEAIQAGEAGIARTIGMLASQFELRAQLADAERRTALGLLRSGGEGPRYGRTTKRDRGQQAAAARAPRPTRRSPMKEAIQRSMKPRKRSGVTFREFMRAWLFDRVGSLRLERIGQQLEEAGPVLYRVTDEDSGRRQDYKRTALEQLYKTCDKGTSR
jgi:hypothetical protein